MNAIIISALMGVVMMFSGIITKNKSVIKNTALAALVVLLAFAIADVQGCFSIKIDTKNMFAFTRFGLFFNVLAIASTLLYVFLSGDDIVEVGNYAAEYFALIFFILCGVSILSSFNNLLIMFIGVEIMSIPLYILTGAAKKNLKSNEAGLKYFLMGSFTTGIMLMGIALLYGASGNFGIEALIKESGTASGNAQKLTPILEVLGLIFVFVAMLFKVSAAPFHFWTPDVYDGAPSVFTSFMASIVKAAGFIAIIILFYSKADELPTLWKLLVSVVVICTLIAGNITAVFQQSVKRMLAYSSIAQAGFMLFALYSKNDLAKEGILFYAVAYSVATVGIFSILVKMEDYTFEGYNGLAKKQPLIAAANTVFLLSLAGIPLTAGFFAKYYMLASVMKAGGKGALWLVLIGVVFAAISVYYYFRVIQAMYFKSGDAVMAPINKSYKIALVVAAAIVVVLGVYPDLLTNCFYFL